MLEKINNLTKYLLELTVFICGAVVMVFELVGSRVLGPYLGTSLYVWTSLIGVILGSLSFGYYLGGKIADKKAEYWVLASAIFISALFITVTVFVKDSLLNLMQNSNLAMIPLSVLASLVLFAPVSIFLGIVSPYAVKLKLNDLKTSGSTVGNLYAISTVGSIAGTFLAGFYLIPHLGTTKILYLQSIILVLTAALLWLKRSTGKKPIVLMPLWLIIAFLPIIQPQNNNPKFLDLDSQYNRIWIYEKIDPVTQKPILALATDRYGIQSAMFLDSDELVHEYTKYYRLAKHFKPNFQKTLMLGGCAYSYPKDFLKEFPAATINVVEIDPLMTTLAKEYFRLKDNPRLKIYHEDARVFINKAREKYDVIYGDAFNSFTSVPYQLTTQEVVKKLYNLLTPEGVAIMNIISAINGDSGKFLRAEYVTYRSIFPQVYLFPVRAATNGEVVQNIMLVALKADTKPKFNSDNLELNRYLSHLWPIEVKQDMPILTDDHAPIDYYHYLIAKNL